MSILNLLIAISDHEIRLQSFIVPKNAPKLTQIPSRTKFLYVHEYGRIEQDEVLSQSLKNDSDFLCVSFVFASAVIKQ